MPKTITSTVEKFPGTVTVSDPLTWPQIIEIEEMIYPERGVPEQKKGMGAFQFRLLPAVCACVEKWELSGFPETVTPETFPRFPRKDSMAIFLQVWGEIWKLYNGDAEGATPNE